MFHKSKLAILLAAVIAFTSVFYVARQDTHAAAVTTAQPVFTIYVAGKLLKPDQPPLLVNDRLLVPVRLIADALGATGDWNGSTQTSTLSLGNTRLDVTIGKNVIIKTTRNADGTVGTTTINLDAPAQLIGNRNMVPLRAVSEGFNCNVAWTQETRTVVVTPLQPTVTPTPTATPTPAINAAFAKTANFEVTDYSRMQTEYNYGNSAIVWYFDSSDATAISQVSAIKQAAATVSSTVGYTVKVYGIDTRTSRYPEQNTWIWKYVSTTTSAPTLIFMYDQTKIKAVTTWSDQSQLVTHMTDWFRGYYSTTTGTPTPTPRASGTVTPTPLPDALFDDVSNMKYTRKSTIQNAFEDDNAFIFVYYDSSRSIDDVAYNVIADAAYSFAYEVYYFDAVKENTSSWFGTGEYNRESRIPNPSVFFVADGEVIDAVGSFNNDNSSTVRELTNDMSDFYNDYYRSWY
ncbi:MAG: copper amine oxidase N-terminal domain-containing protein [Clostridiales bacterium]|jgi:hypothetical protein|nr:copper amine oxidase N-terminal domain-containing protein [Clostridiales bacterium]